MSTKVLSRSETEQWEAWKRAQASVMGAVERAIETASGLSGPDFSVLTRLVELGDGALGQNQLASSLGWDRSRLSRQLARMAARGLLVSTAASGGAARRQIVATEEGRAKVSLARPAHAEAVRTALLRPSSVATDFWSGVRRLSDPADPVGG
ncbi:MarR family winged helix-turn-helix transcriptional regulator [Microbacterium sp. SORGH_AS_0888]|uniref:MarR family winged helix-turn-helix transcriptional regulator n=1 Tax=Microbacterium sp. SORGH_AS_0888 TaxID=3041791 RepID=UPI00278402CA|nr:MarR family winged helix-turn-helix transcriptional regulator [Microbacterium sp. SORGH_AS_0888]MDQ1131227.1 DNA-binding MarR family transcriptional regulator [Microbacterium sp. SORGH_AS_0888]